MILIDLDVATDGLAPCSLPTCAEACSAFCGIPRETFDEGLVLQWLESKRFLWIFEVQRVLRRSIGIDDLQVPGTIFNW